MLSLLRTRGWLVGYLTTAFGVALLFVGLVIDLSLHAADPGLAEEEGPLGFTNPGHIVIFVGLFFILVGLFIGPYVALILRRGHRPLSLLAPLAAIAIALSASVGFSLQIDAIAEDDHHGDAITAEEAHKHPGEANAVAHHSASLPILDKHLEVVEVAESTFHEPLNNTPVSEENLKFAEEFLAKAREQTAKYKDVSVARREGYIMITPDVPLVGAHFMNPALLGSFDPGRPGMLIYTLGADGSWELAGLSFMLSRKKGVDTPPETPLGSLARWHYHTNLCVSSSHWISPGTSNECRGGLFFDETPWLLHVWVWKDSPEGVFNHANSLLQQAEVCQTTGNRIHECPAPAP